MAERDIGFLGVMGWGLMLAESSSAVAAAVTLRVAYFGCRKPLGALFWLRKNLGARYFGHRKPRARTFCKFDIQTLYF